MSAVTNLQGTVFPGLVQTLATLELQNFTADKEFSKSKNVRVSLRRPSRAVLDDTAFGHIQQIHSWAHRFPSGLAGKTLRLAKNYRRVSSKLAPAPLVALS